MPTQTGTDQNDTLNGTPLNDDIYQLDGDDFSDTYEGDDWIYCGDGNDTVLAGNGFNLVFGDGGNDYLIGGGNEDTLWGGDGDDFIEGHGGNDMLYGEAGNDNVVGLVGDDTLIGGLGNNILDGSHGLDFHDGGMGDDTLGSARANDGLVDQMLGGDGNDFIYFSTGDSADGGVGDDLGVINLTYNVGGADWTGFNTSNITLDLSQANMNAVAAGLIGGSVTGFERWGVSTGNGNDSITGSSNGDFISVGSGTDTVNGGSGDDTIYHQTGAARISGGSGRDVFSFGDSTSGNDTITDYDRSEDRILFSERSVIISVNTIDADRDGAVDDTGIIWSRYAGDSQAAIILQNTVFSTSATLLSDSCS